jgi:hypothetical protein
MKFVKHSDKKGALPSFNWICEREMKINTDNPKQIGKQANECTAFAVP